MARARVLGEQSYVLKADRKLHEDDQTLWWYRALKHRERAAILDASTRGIIRQGQKEEERRYGFTVSAIDIVRTALLRVERFVDANGAPLSVPTDRAKVEAWLDLHVEPQDLVELANRFVGSANLTEEDEGNSDSPSASGPTNSGRDAETRNGENAAAAS